MKTIYSKQEKNSYRVYRGGSWNNIARSCRSAYRNRYTPDYRMYYLGLRLSKSKKETV